MKRKVRIKLYAELDEIEVPEEESILQAAMNNALEPPFSCQIGACGSCKAKLTSGKVFMDDTDALSDKELEDEFILTCQAHPITDDCIIDYDF